jgi:hypothetical protein
MKPKGALDIRDLEIVHRLTSLRIPWRMPGIGDDGRF